MINEIILEARIVRKANSFITTQGVPIVEFTLAHNYYTKKTTGFEKQVSYFECVAFGKTAERIVKMDKGYLISIIGSLIQHSYEKNNEKHSVTKILVNKAYLLNKKNESLSESSIEQNIGDPGEYISTTLIDNFFL